MFCPRPVKSIRFENITGGERGRNEKSLTSKNISYLNIDATRVQFRHAVDVVDNQDNRRKKKKNEKKISILYPDMFSVELHDNAYTSKCVSRRQKQRKDRVHNTRVLCVKPEASVDCLVSSENAENKIKNKKPYVDHISRRRRGVYSQHENTM